MSPPLDVQPLTAKRFADLASLFEQGGDPKWCWCVYFRFRGRDWTNSTAAGNRAALEDLSQRSLAPGLVGYDDVPVGWVSLGPREDYERLAYSKVLAPVDDTPVWSIVCFVVASESAARGLLRRSSTPPSGSRTATGPRRSRRTRSRCWPRPGGRRVPRHASMSSEPGSWWSSGGNERDEPGPPDRPARIVSVIAETIDVAGQRFCSCSSGSGPPLVLLHGAWCDARVWRLQLEDLADAFRVIAWDAPGCLASPVPPDDIALDWYADAVAGFVRALGLEGPHLLGLSFGGGLAIEIRPDAIRSSRARWCWRPPMRVGRASSSFGRRRSPLAARS